MKRAIAIEQDLDQIRTVEDLTEVFEGIASVKIARIRNKVVASKEFFTELWQTYSSLRVNPHEQLGKSARKTNGRSVFVAVTSEGKLSGEIANQVVDELVKVYGGSKETDIFVLGTHGRDQLNQHGLSIEKVFSLPESDVQFDVSEIITELAEYKQVSVFYQTYESLRVQRVARIELISAVKELSQEVSPDETAEKVEIVSSKDYIFEPGITEIAEYLESLMMGVALAQVLMESKLAQHAARFNAMNTAKHRAHDMGTEFKTQYYRAKRAEGDERLKEIIKVTQGSLS